MMKIKEWRPKDWLNWNQAWLMDGKPDDEGSSGDYERGADRMFKAIELELKEHGLDLRQYLGGYK